MTLPARFVFALVMLAVPAWTGCQSVTHQVEGAIERELPRVIGPADSYDVRIDGLRATSGQAERVTITGIRVQPEGAPLLERLDAELTGIRFSPRTQTIERADSATATARISASEVALFLEQDERMSDVQVVLAGTDRATIRLRPVFGGMSLPFNASVEVNGRLVVREHNVTFVVGEVRAAGLDVGAAMAQRLSDVINPLVDFGENRANVQVTAVHVDGSHLVVSATGDPTGVRIGAAR
ncbi:hypothetical protein BH23BAC4_BH23BAC4_04990 [soil metagenome]